MAGDLGDSELAEAAGTRKVPTLPNLADFLSGDRSLRLPEKGEGGGGTARGVRFPSLPTKHESVEAPSQVPAAFPEQNLGGLAADVYDESFLEGFVRGYDADKRGRKTRCGSGSTKKSLMSPQIRKGRRWLDYFDELRSAPCRPPSTSPRCASPRSCPSSSCPVEDLGFQRAPSAASSPKTPRRNSVSFGSPSSTSGRHSARPSTSSVASGDRHAAEALHTQRQREACESLRLLVFGRIGNEDWVIQDRHRIFEQQRGTEAEIETFVDQWLLLDDDGNGTIDFTEFLDFFTKKKADKLLGMRCVRYLVGRTGEQHVERSDLIRLLWLRAGDEDVAAMEALFDLKKLTRDTVEPPPLLPKRRRRELLENFRDLDSKGQGHVAYTELVLAGLADEEMMKELRAKYDKDGDGTLDFEEFLEMLCPYGYRAHEKVKVAITKDGEAIRYATCLCGENRFCGWFREQDYMALKSKFGFED